VAADTNIHRGSGQLLCERIVIHHTTLRVSQDCHMIHDCHMTRECHVTHECHNTLHYNLTTAFYFAYALLSHKHKVLYLKGIRKELNRVIVK